LHEFENKGVAAKGVCMILKTKDGNFDVLWAYGRRARSPNEVRERMRETQRQEIG
jgi:hypothetical protein